MATVVEIGDAATAAGRQQHRRHLGFARRFGDQEEVIFAEGEVIAEELAADLGQQARRPGRRGPPA